MSRRPDPENPMQIQSLKLTLTDADLAALLTGKIPPGEGIEDVQARLTPEGVVLAGKYVAGFGFKMPFETLWKLEAAGTEVHARLDNVKVSGLPVPAGMIRSGLLAAVRERAQAHPGVRVTDEAVIVDLPAAALARGGELRVHFTSVRLGDGTAVIEAA